MRLYALKLYQRILLALTFLLLGMNLEQVWCNAQNAQNIKFMYNKQSHSYVTMHSNGTVSTAEPNGPHQCMRYCTVQKDSPLLLSIYNPESRRYLCFNESKKRFVGMRNLTPSCYFEEDPKNKPYFRYKQFRNKHPRKCPHGPVLAFKKSGKLKPACKRRSLPTMPDAELFITKPPAAGLCAAAPECPDIPELPHVRHRKRQRNNV